MKLTPVRIPASLSLLLLLGALLPPAAGHAQGIPATPGSGSAEIRALLAGSGATADEIRQRLHDAGQSDADIEAMVRQLQVSVPAAVPAAAAPAATSAPATPAPPPAPHIDGAAAPAANAAPDPDEPFGMEIFHWSPTTFEPLSYGPVDEDYPLGPGDELALTLWGDDQLSLTLPVNREGAVSLPDVGQVSVQGLTLEETRARLRVALAHVYSGLRPAGQHSTTFVSLSLGKLRTIQVFLLGQVSRPGSYSISSVSRVLNALYAAGGPTREGSLRDVRILRGGHVNTHVDLYDVILGGDPGRVARLQNGDVVFVPPAQRRVTVKGPVRRPGIFELREGEELRALLALAGGPLPEAELSQAQIDRITPLAWRDSLPGQGRVALDVALGAVLADPAHDLPVLDADVLVLVPMPNRHGNVVLISGRGIARPGRYEYRPGMRAADLIAAAGGPSTDAYLDNALVTRTLPDSSRVSLRFAPGGALRGEPADNIALRPMDDVTIRSIWDLKERQTVSVHGNVRSPGTFELLDGMTLADLLMRAGGFTDDADPQRAEIARIAEGTAIAGAAALSETLQVPLQRDLAQARVARATLLMPHDAVFIRRDPEYAEPTYVTLEGEVRFPGTYAVMRRDERVSDLVRRAGGPTEFAYARGATFVREGHQTLAIDLPRSLRHPHDAQDLVLQAGDVLHVPRYSPTVAIEGAVFSPVTALYREGAHVGYYVTQASGFRRDADRHNVVVIAPNGHVQRSGAPEPGSRIVVPARPETAKSETLKEMANIFTIVASALTTIILVRQVNK